MFSTLEHARSNANPNKYPLLDPHHFGPGSGSESMSFYSHGFSQDSGNQNHGHGFSQDSRNQNYGHGFSQDSRNQNHAPSGIPASSTVDALLSEFNHFTNTMNQNFDCDQVNLGSLLKTQSPPVIAPPPLPAQDNRPTPGTSPEALLNIISVTQQKLQNLQSLVQMMVHGGGQQHHSPDSLASSYTSIMSQLFAATSSLQVPPGHTPSAGQLNLKFDSRLDGLNGHGGNNSLFPPGGNYVLTNNAFFHESTGDCSSLISDIETNSNSRAAPRSRVMENGPISSKVSVILQNDAVQNCIGSTTTTSIDAPQVENIKSSPNSGFDPGSYPSDDASGEQAGILFEDQDFASNTKEEEDDGDGENLPPGSYELLEMAAAEILAEHTHFCDICGKGFKRDANLRMHMRGHGDEYKTPAALARPDKASDQLAMKPRRYSCPYVGCKRNRKHRKFQPLKTVLCVKNHYRRSHCPKLLTCSKCKAKKFSVVADLKTHEKHCGRDKWQCSCGTTFSRKDKLVGHISLFAGHTPAVPLNDGGNSVVSNNESNHVGSFTTPAKALAMSEGMYQSRSGAANGGQVINQPAMMNQGNQGMSMCGMSVTREVAQGAENNFRSSNRMGKGNDHVFLGM